MLFYEKRQDERRGISLLCKERYVRCFGRITNFPMASASAVVLQVDRQELI
jgi:hypothetical protein